MCHILRRGLTTTGGLTLLAKDTQMALFGDYPKNFEPDASERSLGNMSKQQRFSFEGDGSKLAREAAETMLKLQGLAKPPCAPVRSLRIEHRVRQLPGKHRVYRRREGKEREGIEESVLVEFRAAFRGWRPWPLVLTGEAGSGKTCAALGFLDACGGMYWVLRELCDEVNIERAQHHAPRETWATFGSRNLVVLDEVGLRDKPSDPECEVLHTALETRLDLPLIIISNRGLKELEQLYGDPVASRLMDGTLFRFEGDRRGKHDG